MRNYEIDNNYIQRTAFYKNIKEINNLFINFFKNNSDYHKEKIGYYLYKIANIVALQRKIFLAPVREEIIQDAVYICFKRLRCFKLSNETKNPYGYFYKLIDNHIKDICRKKIRRKNIINFISLDAELKNNWPKNQPF